MKRQLLLYHIVCAGLVALSLIGCRGAQVGPTTTTSDGKRALFVIYEQFEENEYGLPRAILEDGQVTVTVTGTVSYTDATRIATFAPRLCPTRFTPVSGSIRSSRAASVV